MDLSGISAPGGCAFGVEPTPLKVKIGPEEDRTPDPLLAKQVLSQLSYRPLPYWWAQVDSNH